MLHVKNAKLYWKKTFQSMNAEKAFQKTNQQPKKKKIIKNNSNRFWKEAHNFQKGHMLPWERMKQKFFIVQYNIFPQS